MLFCISDPFKNMHFYIKHLCNSLSWIPAEGHFFSLMIQKYFVPSVHCMDGAAVPFILTWLAVEVPWLLLTPYDCAASPFLVKAASPPGVSGRIARSGLPLPLLPTLGVWNPQAAIVRQKKIRGGEDPYSTPNNDKAGSWSTKQWFIIQNKNIYCKK